MRGRDVSDAGVIADLAREIGVANHQQAVKDPAVKQRLRENTDWSIVRGVFGVPTFVIDDEIFWGHDAFDMVVDYLRNRAQFQDAEMQKIEQLPIGVVRRQNT